MACENWLIRFQRRTHMNERIHAQIVSGEIAALTIDTSIFERAGLALESGLLAQLVQFRKSDIKLVLAGTVANEVRRHLAGNAEKAMAALQMALRETARHQVLPGDLQQRMMKDVEVVNDGEALSARTRNQARQRFDHWVEWVRATVIDEAEFASIGEVMRRYEASEPPFSAAGNKKHEFPDAIALSTLEGWARASRTRVLAVTQDKDWKRYGEQSSRIVMVDDLADALAAFQRRAEAHGIARRIRESLGDGDSLGLGAALLVALAEQDGVLNLTSRLTRHTSRFTMKASTSPFRSWKFST
ncbi:hypothetical protein R75465_07706 [Paraburkholderia aspalathi]|nr:hypothetical protein R75465_07706 [Paraburkholderia aspalathi]